MIAATLTGLLGVCVGFVWGALHRRRRRASPSLTAAARGLDAARAKLAPPSVARVRARLERAQRDVREVADRVASHEAGHVVAAWASPTAIGPTSATIEPQNGWAGHVLIGWRTDVDATARQWDRAVVNLAGLAGECFLHGKARSGPAGSDLTEAREAAEAIVAAGFTTPPWGTDVTAPTGMAIGAMFVTPPPPEVCAVLDAAYRRARHVLHGDEHRFALVVEALLARRTLDAEALAALAARRRCAA